MVLKLFAGTKDEDVTFQGKVIAGGKIVIPARVRHELGIADGDRLAIDVIDGAITIRTMAQTVCDVQERFRHLKRQDVSEVDDFIAQRRAEAAREDEASDFGRRS